jgi:hypothetical protein
MQTFTRTGMTSGVALIGASVIALSPIVVTPQQVHLPAIPVSSVAVTLTASVDPISEWVQVLTTTFNNISALGQQVSSNPAPILKQIIANQIGYATTISTALGAAGNSFVTTLTELPPALRQAAQQLAAGQISAGLNTAFQAMLNLVVNPGLALMQSPILSIPGQVLQNLTNVVKLLPDVIVAGGLSVLTTVAGVQSAFGDTAQAVYDGVRAGDLGAVVNAIVNAPAVLTNAFLNGYSPTGAWGILSEGFGLVPLMVVSIRDVIAQALGAPAPFTAAVASPDTGPSALPSAASLTSVSALPTGTGNTITVALSTEPKVEAPVEETPAAETPVEETPVDETPSETPVEETPVDSEPSEDDDTGGSGNGATDLSGGNKVTPGQTGSGATGSDSDSADTDAPDSPADDESATSGADSGAATGTGSGSDSDNDGSGTSDSSDSGSDSDE